MNKRNTIAIGEFTPNATVENVYVGKVRTCFTLDDKFCMVVTDKISAFDVVLPQAIPYKGMILNLMASKALDETADIVPNWKMRDDLHPMMTIGHKCEPFMIEMIIRGILTGSLWRLYKKEGPEGVKRDYDIDLPAGMKENEMFPEPIITPTTKAETGHDAPITKAQILEQGYATPEEYMLLEEFTYALFQRGTEIAAKRGLILVDTKYEFGKKYGQIYLIDEIHTPDSSRFFYSNGYKERFDNGEPQKQLSKEFVREWLMAQGFKGDPGQTPPDMSPEFIQEVSERYIELYEKITGDKFEKVEYTEEDIQHIIMTSRNPKIAIIMGSTSDWNYVQPVADALKERGHYLYFAARSAHRTPEAVEEFVKRCEANDIKVILAAAGLAAALPGVVASLTPIPVIGIALDAGGFDGIDAVLAIAQMPPGVPALCVFTNDRKYGPEANCANMIANVAVSSLRKFKGINILLETDIEDKKGKKGVEHERVVAAIKILEEFGVEFRVGELPEPDCVNIQFTGFYDTQHCDVDGCLFVNCLVANTTDVDDAYNMLNVSKCGPIVGLNRGENAALMALKFLAMNDEDLYEKLHAYRVYKAGEVLEKETSMKEEWSQYK
ncbi:phosphoribosylaminoimidazolesuccinocarboxamide synthase [Patescibacteria group bacterium]|nr:phosphoribosylaminoimidazolesuccinocarboxamide synthase [Patescibacteria group bacterium]MBU1758709.1 phosphoribosylaminoimidazolesuccinocarboxamide synthase [Patescibacteria group bacterium]